MAVCPIQHVESASGLSVRGELWLGVQFSEWVDARASKSRWHRQKADL